SRWGGRLRRFCHSHRTPDSRRVTWNCSDRHLGRAEYVDARRAERAVQDSRQHDARPPSCRGSGRVTVTRGVGGTDHTSGTSGSRCSTGSYTLLHPATTAGTRRVLYRSWGAHALTAADLPYSRPHSSVATTRHT